MAGPELQTIKDRIDIVDLISSYIQVKRSGTNYKAVCPFHNEKTPSLMISPQKQIWHCFGCGEGGDIFGFLMRQENIGFHEALKQLADKAGVQLPQYTGSVKVSDDARKLAVRINNFAAKYYHKLLFEKIGQNALEYIIGRGLTRETIEKWQIGFAPDDFHGLEQELAKKGVRLEDLVKAGVSVESDRGGAYDRFRNRLMFPIYDYFGDCVGFSARTMEASTQSAKYINSPETVAYNKSKILFGLYKAKESIRKNDEVVIVEGQMDCIQAHQAGFSNTVATSGTALTQEQLKVIKRLASTIKLCFDADAAGVQATWRAGEVALALGLKVKIIEIIHGKDPDELIRTNASAWQSAIDESKWFLDFYIKRGLKEFVFDSVEQKKYVDQTLKPLLALLTDPIEREHYQAIIAKDYGLSPASLAVLSSKSQGQSSGQALEQSSQATIMSNSVLALEKQVLGGIFQVPEYRQTVLSDLNNDDFQDARIRVLVDGLKSESGLNPELLEEPLAKEAQFMVESQLEYLENNHTALLNELQKSFHLLKLHGIRTRLQQLTVALKQAESQGLTDRAKAIGQEFALLSAQRMQHESKI